MEDETQQENQGQVADREEKTDETQEEETSKETAE